jgi:predicted dehydrogenase
MTLDPGHFHAALVQKQRLAGVEADCWVYAPPGPDLNAHLARVAAFRNGWTVHVSEGEDSLERLLAERPGDVVVLAGRNSRKIDRIQALVAGGLHVLADKPWIIDAADLAKVEAALARKDVVAFDGMTERFDIVHIVERMLVSNERVFGAPEYARMSSVHHLYKTVAGVPLIRPAWFFDICEQGDGIADVGTHLVDLMHWILFPDAALDYRGDIRILESKRWPTVLSPEQYQRVTAEPRDTALEYWSNGSVAWTVRGVEARIEAIWNYEGADNYSAEFRGTRATVRLEGGEVYVEPRARREAVEALGLTVEERGDRLRVVIAPEERIGHEAHFARLLSTFLGYAGNPASLPPWEAPNMLAKYYVTTARP